MLGKAKFQQHCEKLVSKLGEKTRTRFNLLQDDLSRVKFLYPLALDADIDVATWAPKDVDRSESLKASGNKLFQNGNFSLAINVYNEALLRCPQDYLEGQKLHAILIANRSAVFFELKQYDKVLKDIEFVKVYGHHPTPYKLHIRGGKACEALEKYATAINFYKEALADLKTGEKVNDKQITEIESKIGALKKLKKSQRKDVAIVDGSAEESMWQSKNITYPALSSKVAVKNDVECGRYIVAKEDIKVGEIIAVEQPYVCVLSAAINRTNCAFCISSINQMIVCEWCCQACYCSFECKKRASVYHQFECQILLTLFDAGVSVNCLMAFRMVTQRSLSQLIQDENYAKDERNVVIYQSNDYYNVANLVMHKDRVSDDFVHFGFMSTYLVRLLKTTHYFDADPPNTTASKSLTENEALVASLILKYLQILQFNAHEISELQNAQGPPGVQRDINYKTGSVGAGLYATLALFNHSCDPSVVRYNIGQTMVLRTIKPIKYGDGVFENYGPLYTSDNRDVRQAKLRNSYRFDCRCQACAEDWPLFAHIDANVLRVACECGGVIPTDKNIEIPLLTCTNCKKDKNLLPVLKGLMPLEIKSNKAEELFNRGEHKEAIAMLVDMLGTYVKYLVPPFSDMVLLQQRLKTCLIHKGNKKFDYRFLRRQIV